MPIEIPAENTKIDLIFHGDLHTGEMPVIPRKRKRDEESNEQRAKRPKTRKIFEVYSSIGYKEDGCHSLYMSIPNQLEELQEVVSKELVSLLNANGGILCFGARSSGIVHGQRISRREEDVFKCTIDEVVKRIHPMVKPGMYRVSFTPVVDQRGRDTQYSVLEIRVQKGDPFQVYETGGSDPKLGKKKDSQVYLRDGRRISLPLTPHQIKEHTIQLLKEKLKYEADLAEKLKSPLVDSSATPPSVEIVKVIPAKDANRVPFKSVNSQKKEDKDKRSPIVISSCDESDENPIPDIDSNSESAAPSKVSQPRKKVSKTISSLVKSFKKSVKDKFGTKQVTTVHPQATKGPVASTTAPPNKPPKVRKINRFVFKSSSQSGHHPLPTPLVNKQSSSAQPAANQHCFDYTEPLNCYPTQPPPPVGTSFRAEDGYGKQHPPTTQPTAIPPLVPPSQSGKNYYRYSGHSQPNYPYSSTQQWGGNYTNQSAYNSQYGGSSRLQRMVHHTNAPPDYNCQQHTRGYYDNSWC